MADKWHFLEPWLELLAPNILAGHASGWQHDMHGAASLAPHLHRLSISIPKSFQNILLTPPQLRTLGRAMEIVTMALRVDPQVWKLLRIILWGTLQGTDPMVTMYHNGVERGYFFRDENVAAVVWDVRIDVTDRVDATDELVSSVEWLLRGQDHTDSESDSFIVSATAYRDALAHIRRLNSFRVALDDPIPVMLTIIGYLGYQTTSDQLLAIVSSASSRFEVTALKVSIDKLPNRCDHSVADLLQRLQQTGVASVEVDLTHSVNRVNFTIEMTRKLQGINTKRLALQVDCDQPRVVHQMRFAFGRAVDTSDAQSRAPWDCEDADVERLELQAHWSPTHGYVDPLELAAKRWGRHSTCRLLQQSQIVSSVLRRLLEANTSGSPVTMVTEFECIPGNDPSVTFLVMPSANDLVRVETSALAITTVNASAAPPPRWLAKVRSLQVTHREVVTFAAIPQLRHLMPSLVSLELTSYMRWGDVLPRILLSLPSSLQYLQLHGWADSPSHLQALFQAYDDNALHVRSLKIDFKESQSLLRLLTALSDPTSGIASHLEELVVKFGCHSPGDDTEILGDAIERVLVVNKRLDYFHIIASFPREIRDQWRAKVAPFHRTLARNRVGRRHPRVCTLALISVIHHYEFALDSGVVANIVAFANSGLVRIAMVS